jgi:hypothetical protein
MKSKVIKQFQAWPMVFLLSVSLVLSPFSTAFGQNNNGNNSNNNTSTSSTTGCVTSPVKDYSTTGFDINDFDATNVFQDAENDLKLDTAKQAINPERIIIPVEQEVYATFIFEGAGHVSDFGYVLLEDAVEKDTNGNIKYRRVPSGTSFYYETYDPDTDLVKMLEEDQFFMRDSDGNYITDGSGDKKRVAADTTFEYAAYDSSNNDYYLRDDLGMLIEKFAGWDNIADEDRHPIFVKINTNNGMLKDDTYYEAADAWYTATGYNKPDGTARPTNPADLRSWNDGTGIYYSPNGDTVVDEKDMRKLLGTFEAGTELVFFLADDKRWDTDSDNKIRWSKKEWNTKDYNASRDANHNKTVTVDGTNVTCNFGGKNGMPRTPSVKRIAESEVYYFDDWTEAEDDYFARWKWDDADSYMYEEDGTKRLRKASDLFVYEAHSPSNDEYFLRDENGDLIEGETQGTYKRIASDVDVEWEPLEPGYDGYRIKYQREGEDGTKTTTNFRFPDGNGSLPKDDPHDYYFRDDTGSFIENTDDDCYETYKSYWVDWNPNVDPEDQWFRKVYELGKSGGEKWTYDKNGWMKGDAVDSLEDNFGFALAEDDTDTLLMKQDEPFEYVIVGAPADDPDQWVLGWEDLGGGGDTDHNDLVFRIERKTGGDVELIDAIPASTVFDDAYYTGATLEVWDVMPSGACEGKAKIEYEVSVDNGVTWVPVDNDDWDVVKCVQANSSGEYIAPYTLGTGTVDDWRPGYSDPYCDGTDNETAATYRKKRIDFFGMGIVGQDMKWRANLFSESDGCVPEILNVRLEGSVSRHAFFSRAEPVAQANLLYSGNYESPDINDTDWMADPVLRGHVTATKLYEQSDPTLLDTPTEVWDAGEQLKTRAANGNLDGTDGRTIYYPDVTATHVTSENLHDNWTRTQGTKTYTGSIANGNISSGTLKITVDVGGKMETFTDKHGRKLVGDKNGTGTIDRYNGTYELTLANAPDADDNSTTVTGYAEYVYTTFSDPLALKELKTDNDSITRPLLSLLDYTGGDLNGDNNPDDTDKSLLINWTRGYQDNGTTAKLWPLGPVDHSVPALVTPPGTPGWLYGTAITNEMVNSYKTFRDDKAERDSVLFVGARDGMLHAFDAGQFRWGDNPDTTITEKRGYFKDSDYGTGDELWAFIPAALLPKLKNNLLETDNQAFVDASPTIVDVYIPDGTSGDWKTVLLSALGNGGDSVFCLDVTDPTSPTFMWEYTNPSLYKSSSSPSAASVGQIISGGNATWVGMFVSGDVASGEYPAIFVVDIATGSLIKKIDLDRVNSGDSTQTAVAGGTISGQPALLDSDSNGYIDRMYLGMDNGNLYKVNLPDDPSTPGDISYCVLNSGLTVTDDGGIFGSPTVVADNDYNTDGSIDYNIKVLYGTGDSPFADEDLSSTTYHFFALVDEDGKGECSAGTLDWSITLPANNRIWSSAFAAAGKVYFGTTTAETEDPCEGYSSDAGTGDLYVVDINLAEDATDPTQTTVDIGSNINVTPVVFDQNVLTKKPTGGVDVVGSGTFNNEINSKGSGESETLLWREVNSY